MTTPPLTDKQYAAIRAGIAAAFEREDVNWGYSHGFCADPSVDPQTAAFVDAALAVVRPELDQLRAERDVLNTEVQRLLAEVRSRMRISAGQMARLDRLEDVEDRFREAQAERAEAAQLSHQFRNERDRLRDELAHERDRVAYWRECRDNYAAENRKLLGQRRELRAQVAAVLAFADELTASRLPREISGFIAQGLRERLDAAAPSTTN